MAWQVIQYMDENPGISMKDVIGHFAEQYEVDMQQKYLLREVDDVLEIRDQLRPLYGEKANVETNLALIDSDLDMEVMLKYPPRQGSDKERKAYKAELQKNHADHSALSSKLETIKNDLQELELKMGDVQQRAKNARRTLETFNHIAAFIIAYYGSEAKTGTGRTVLDFCDDANNLNTF